MPTIARLSNCTVYIYADDHAPPHFHLRGPDSNAMISIESAEVIAGRAHGRDLAEAQRWVNANRDLLRREWRRING